MKAPSKPRVHPHEKSLRAASRMDDTILIVNDEFYVRSLVSVFLTQHGYRTLGARNALEALSIFRAYQDAIQVVITDGHMPAIAEAEFSANLRRMKPGIRIMIFPGLIEPSAPGGPTEESPLKPFEIGAPLTAVQMLSN